MSFHPSILELIPRTALPGDDFDMSALTDTALGKIHYKNLMVESSRTGEQRFYSLSLGGNNAGTEGIPIFGTGLSLKLIGGPTISVHLRWEILRYVRGFRLEGFGYTEQAFFDLFLHMTGATKEEVIEEIMAVFIDDLDPFQKLLQELSSLNLPSNILNVHDLVQYAKTNNKDIFGTLFQNVIADTNTPEEIWENLQALFRRWLGDFTMEEVKDLLIPKVRVETGNMGVAIEFPRTVLLPLDQQGVVIPEGSLNDKSLLTFPTVSVAYSTETGFDFNVSGGGASLSPSRSRIGKTGFEILVTDVKLDLSRKKNIPEADADGRPVDFIGVYIKDGIVGFPAEWGHNKAGSTGELYVNNLLAGTGGLSGTIGLRGNIITPANGSNPAVRESNPLISVQFGEKFSVSLYTFSIKFQQNAILESDIWGTLTIPDLKDANKQEVKIRIQIHFGQNGDFFVNTEEKAGIELHLSDFLTITVQSMRLEKRSGKFFFAVSGSIGFGTVSGFIGSFLPKKIDIDKLLIWQNGQIELEGGVVTLAQPIKLNLGPVKLTVTALGMGSHERMHGGKLRKYKYVEFSAGISINPGGVDARGDGIKVYFSIDNNQSEGRDLDIYVRIQSIAIDLIIPGSASKDKATLLLSGYLSMKEPTPGAADSDAGTEYAGGIDFKLPKMKMGGSADMRYNPKVPSFLIDVSLEISTPIVLGATGMGIYGFRALFGKRYVVSKTAIGLTDDSEWWQYYKKKVPPKPKEGITVFKMANKAGFSFGAGVSLATAADGGQAFSSKLFFLLSLPDVFLLQGQAQILKGRIGLDSDNDPPFFALIAIDKTSISAALGVSYKIPEETGAIVTVDALIEMAYFWHDSHAWYLNIGRDQPVDRRVRARIFDLFDVYSYFMLSASGIRAGAGASLEKEYNVGPIKASMHAYMDTAGRLSFKPLQIGGSIQIGGNVDLKVCGFGFSVVASASLAAEAPKPFIVTGAADACVKVMKKEYCCHFDFTWTFKQELDFNEVAVLTAGVIGKGGSPAVNADLQTAVKALNMMSLESLNVLCIDNITIPPPGAPTAGTIPPLSNMAVWQSKDNEIDKYVLPMDSYIDIEFRKPVNPIGDLSLLRFGGTNIGVEFTDYVAPQRGKSDRVRHDYMLNKVEIFSWNPLLGKWENYNVFEALITGLKKPPFNLTLQEETDLLANGQYGFWQIDNPGKYTKLRLMAQNPLSFLRQGTGDTIPEELGVTNGIFCPPPKRRKTCVNFDSFVAPLHGGPASLTVEEVEGNKILQHQRILMRIVRNKGRLLMKAYSGVKTALSYVGGDTLELYLPEPSPEVSLLVGTTTNGLTIKYFTRKQKTALDIQNGIVPVFDNSGLPVFEYLLVGTVTKTPVQLAGGVHYSDLQKAVDKIEITGIMPNVAERKELYCEASISGEAQALLQLLNLIGKEGLIIPLPKPPRDLMLDPYRETTIAVFPNFLAGTSLFYLPTPTKDTLTINFSPDAGVTVFCQITLTVAPPGSISAGEWQQLGAWRFSNLRPDTNGAILGANYNFLIDVEMPTGTKWTLKGNSRCIPIYNCYSQYLNFFHQICYLNTVDAQYNQNLPSAATVAQNNQSMAAAINKTLWPIWRPDTVFAVRVEYHDKIYQESDFKPNESKPKAFVIGFKTQGPIGHYHEFPVNDITSPSKKLDAYKELEDKDKEDTFKLSSLKYYIDYPKSYPNADGNILNAKPLYYGSPELRLFYIYPHVYQCYQNWDTYNGAPKVESSLEVLIKDPAEALFVPDPQNDSLLISYSVPSANNEWVKNDFPVITPDIAALNNMINNGTINHDPCLPSQKPFTPPGINNLVTPSASAPLEPLKLYTAIYKAVYKPTSIMTPTASPVRREVHRYAFQTSRYKDFKEHINSYILQRNAVTKVIEKSAVYTLEVLAKTPEGDDDPMPIIRARQVLDGTLPADDALHTEAALDFDKLIDRLFALSGLEPAENVQFNKIMDGASGKMLGILVRSPEPFNDPKTPANEMAGTLEMLPNVNVKPKAKHFTTYFSKDNSSAFITNSNHSMDVPVGEYRFDFKYKLFNGNKYETRATEQVMIDFDPHWDAQ